VDGLPTVHTTPLEVHACGKDGLGADRALNLHPELWWRLLHKVRLEDETRVPTLCRAREASRDLLLCTQELMIRQSA
jgi:hypothetical protein